MNRYVMPKTALTEWLGSIIKTQRVIGPKALGDEYVFAEIKSPAEIELNYDTTLLPPKKALLPPHEDLIEFNLAEEHFEPVLENQPTVIFGIHTCDLHAITLLDQVFNQKYTDQHYASRRNSTTMVSIECLRPCSEHAFCKDMGTLTTPDAFDLHLTDLGDVYSVDIGSEKGRSLIANGVQFREPVYEDYRKFNQAISNKWARFPYRLDADVTELPSLLSISQKLTLWEDLGERCLGCGTCTVVCPTCYCFDVSDEVDLALNAGKRYRVWDSCQLNQFASVAGGHDFRAGRSNRLKHRFLRKYKYQNISPGLVGCVGCGRCAQTCLVNITPIDVLNKIYHLRNAYAHNRTEVPAL